MVRCARAWSIRCRPSRPGDLTRAAEINRAEVRGQADKTFGTLIELSQAQSTLLDQSLETQHVATADAQRATAVITVVLIAMSAWLSLVLIRGLLGQIEQALGAARRVAEGDLSVAIPAQGQDEMAQLLREHSSMQGMLANIVHGVRGHAKGVATASAQISHGNQDLSGRTEA